MEQLTMAKTYIGKTYDLYDLLTGDELDQVTNIFLEAFTRSKGIEPEVFEIETKIIVETLQEVD